MEIKRMDKLHCLGCKSEWWVSLMDGKVCNCPQCGGTENEKVDEWEVKPEPVVVKELRPYPAESACTHVMPMDRVTCTTSAMIDFGLDLEISRRPR